MLHTNEIALDPN